MPDAWREAAVALLSVTALGVGVACVVTRAPARVGLWLAVAMSALAGVLLALGAGYVAIATLVLLAGAVPSLLLLSGPTPRQHSARGARRWLRLAAAVLMAASLAASAAFALAGEGAARAVRRGAPGVADLGHALFAGRPLAVAAAALLLLTVMVAAARTGGGDGG